LLRKSIEDAAGAPIDSDTILDVIMDVFKQRGETFACTAANSTENTSDYNASSSEDTFDDSLSGAALVPVLPNGLPTMRIDSVEPFFGQEGTKVPLPPTHTYCL
jgi:hypothetical protein